MRILMLAQFYPPVIGGVERHVYDLSNELTARGHDIVVVTFGQQGLPAFEDVRGVRIYRIHGSLQRANLLFTDQGQRHAPPFVDPEVLWTLQRIIKHERPAIVHTHNWIGRSFLPLKRWSGCGHVVSLHDCSHVCATKTFMFHGTLCDGPAAMKCLRCATEHYGPLKGPPIALGARLGGMQERRATDMFLPVSQAVATASKLDTCGVPYRIIPNFMSGQIAAPLAGLDGYLKQLPPGDFLLFVGNLIPEKGVDTLLRAYAAMHSDIPLVIIGRVKDSFVPAFPPNVVFLPNWPHAAVMAAWSRCTLGLIPSICLEAFGIVALEAMSMGKPIIASRIGGLAEVVDSETGILVTPGDWQALQQAIQHLLDNQALRESMGRKALQRVALFQADTVVTRIEQAYQEVRQLYETHADSQSDTTDQIYTGAIS